MAKKKKSKKTTAQPVRLNPEHWMREIARTLPLGPTYMNYHREVGLASVLVSRIRPSGNVAFVLFLVDTFCLGVKHIIWQANVDISDWPARRDRMIKDLSLKEVPYAEAHNIIYGAVEWAGEADIMPCSLWETAKYILEDDTDDVPYIEYEFGNNGTYLLISSRPEEKRLVPILKKRLGDRFHFTVEITDDDLDIDRFDFEFNNFDDYDEIMDDDDDDDERFADEPYSYPDRPDYPRECEVKNPWLRDALTDPANMFGLPKEISDRIMALPPDEAATDLATIIEWEVGRKNEALERDDEIDSSGNALLLAMMYLSVIDSRAGLSAAIDVARQDEDFLEYQLGDYGEELIGQTLYTAAGDDLSPLVKLLSEPGLSHYGRFYVATGIAMTAASHPDRLDEVTGIFRDELRRLLTDLPERRGADGTYVGFLMSLLDDLAIPELLPEIKAVFDTGCVNLSIAGNYNDVVKRMKKGRDLSSYCKFRTLADYQESLEISRRISESANR